MGAGSIPAKGYKVAWRKTVGQHKVFSGIFLRPSSDEFLQIRPWVGSLPRRAGLIPAGSSACELFVCSAWLSRLSCGIRFPSSMAEWLTCNQRVVGSVPTGSSNAQLAKWQTRRSQTPLVAGSIPALGTRGRVAPALCER